MPSSILTIDLSLTKSIIMKTNLSILLISWLLFSCSKQPEADYNSKKDVDAKMKLNLPAFNKLYGSTGEDYLQAFVPGNDGGYVFAGHTTRIESGNITGGMWIVKVDSYGKKIWEKTYVGSGVETAYSIAAWAGGYIIVGKTYGTIGNMPAIYGDGDGLVLKIDESGNAVSQRAFGGADYDEFVKIIPDEAGNYLLVGHTYSTDGNFSTNHGASDLFAIKIDAWLNPVWQKTFGSTGSESGVSGAICKDGGYIITGYTDGNDGDLTFNHGGIDFWALNVSGDGEIIWQRTYGGSGFELASSTTASADGGCVITGLTTSSDGDITTRKGGFVDGWLVKIDKHGALKWDKTVGGTNFEQCLFSMTTHNGDYLIGGNTTSIDGDFVGNKGGQDGWAMHIDKQGNEKWVRVIGGKSIDLFKGAHERVKGNYILAGYSESNDGDVSGNHGFTDAWLLSLTEK
jgi:hypothetical protein